MGTAQAVPAVTPIEQRGYAHPEVLVSTDWVAQHLNDPKVRLVESNEDILLYDTGHIPGAVKLDWTTDLNDQVIRDYVTEDRLQALLRSRGINNDTTIVFYGDKNNWWATYALWVLQLFGVTNVKILDGGRLRWVDEGRTLSTDVPSYPAGNITIGERTTEDPRVPRGRAQAPEEEGPAGGRAESRGVPRRADPHARVSTGGRLRGGHIPGAKSIPWAKAIDPETHTFKTAAELRKLYEQDNALRRTQERSPIAGSASGRRTPGSRSPTCSASTRCGTTTGRGPSGATRCGCRWRSRRSIP